MPAGGVEGAMRVTWQWGEASNSAEVYGWYGKRMGWDGIDVEQVVVMLKMLVQGNEGLVYLI